MLAFISYNRLDRDFALLVREQLHSWDYDTWIDIEDIPKGAHWPDEIDEGLAAADVVIGIMSEHSMCSRNVKNEWDWALEYDKPLLLVRLRPCTISVRYIRINYIDFVKDEVSGFAQLKKALIEPRTHYGEIEGTLIDDVQSNSIASDKKTPIKREIGSNRDRLLRSVREFWIEGVLAPAKVGDIWLTLESERQETVVQPRIERELHHPDFDSFALGSGEQIADMFDRLGKELLILGAPGAGKTMTLLELAQALIARAETDPALPVPVVLNLASWAEKQMSFVEWLYERLSREYNVPHKLGQRWIENGELMFLLDGLDEVPVEHRDACVAAINDFWKDYDYIDNGMVVCSRIADYEVLTEQLHLDNAIVLKALTTEQVDSYLARLGGEWGNLRAALSQSASLQAFAESPLLLNIMAVAYQGMPVGQITGFASEAIQKKHVFDHYVARRLRERAPQPKYTVAQTRHYLAWLARETIEHKQIIFQIEGLQPSWLNSQQFQLFPDRAAWAVRLMVGVLTGLTIGLGSGLFFGIKNGLAVGLLTGVVSGLSGGTVFGFAVGLGEKQNAKEIQTTERLRWSWPAALRQLKIGGIGGASIGLLGGMISGLGIGLAGIVGLTFVNVVTGLIFGLIFGLFFGLIFGLGGGIRGRVFELAIIPNQGIHSSVKNAALVGLMDCMAIGLFFYLIIAAIDGMISGLIIGLVFGLVVGLTHGLRFGGRAVIQHIALRVILNRSGVAPLNYADFLDFCAERQLLRRVGGGYIFRHRMLMEYFAGLAADS